uniref:Uncharacterized protein n=1 Tax=Globodera rostochiensis TaxID=31243 RepID=A0A914I3U2_GLORO
MPIDDEEEEEVEVEVDDDRESERCANKKIFGVEVGVGNGNGRDGNDDDDDWGWLNGRSSSVWRRREPRGPTDTGSGRKLCVASSPRFKFERFSLNIDRA